MATQSNIFHVLVGVAVLAFYPICHAQITLDGTVGPGVVQDLTPIGDTFDITDNLGTTVGNNLFHSFGEFNLTQSQIASFSGPANIANIISRVTGGNTSNINGLLKSEIAGANFFLINPAGVIFGPNAQLDVSGSFVVSTADELRLADGGVFSAIDPNSANNVLTSATPSAFGFLDGQPLAQVGVEVDGAKLEVEAGQSLTVVVDDGMDGDGETVAGITLIGGKLVAPNGQVNLVSVASTGEVPYDSTTEAIDLAIEGFSKLGSIDVRDDSTINVNENAGQAVIHGGRLTIKGESTIEGGDVYINTESVEIIGTESLAKIVATEGTGILAFDNPFAQGQKGDITIKADRLEMSNGGLIGTVAISLSGSSDIDINANKVSVDQSLIFSATLLGVAPGGEIHIEADELKISGTSNLSIEGPSLFGTPIFSLTIPSGILSVTDQGFGKGGDIRVEAADIEITGLAALTSLAGPQTGGSGHGGDILLTVDDTLRMSGQGAIDPIPFTDNDVEIKFFNGNEQFLKVVGSASIVAITQGETGGGNISIDAHNIGINDSAVIGSVAIEGGNAGDISIHADSLLGLGDRSDVSGGIMSAALSKQTAGENNLGGTPNGDAGDITIHTTDFEFKNGALLGTVTLGTGQGGDIVVNASRISLSSDETNVISLIITETNNSQIPNAGNAGSIMVTADDLLIQGSAGIAAVTVGTGNSGNINVDADAIFIDGQGDFSGVFTNSFEDGKGGDVQVNGGSLQLINGALLGATATGKGDAGDITVDVDNIVIDGHGLELTTPKAGNFRTGVDVRAIRIDQTSNGGEGGNILIKADSLTVLGAGEIASSTLGPPGTTGDSGDITINVSNNILLSDNSAITAFSESTNGGDIIAIAGNDIVMFDSEVNAQAALDGGNIKLTAPNIVRIVRSTITGQAGQDGGRIAIDPIFVILDHSIINGLAGGQPVLVTIDPNAIFLSSQSQILTTTVSLPPELDLSGSLAQLPETFIDDISQLSEACAIKLQGEFSSFIVVGRGGVPVKPDSGLPSFYLSGKTRNRSNTQGLSN